MWVKANPNPCRTETEDCVVRAICLATGRDWHTVHRELCDLSGDVCSMPSVNWVWGLYLRELGFRPYRMRERCPACISVREFCRRHPHGTYILGTGHHAVAVISGDYWDAWDSGDEVAILIWKAREQQWPTT